MSDFSLGEKLRVTLFGQSHAEAVGCVIEGLPAGMTPDTERVKTLMRRRAPGRNAWSTPRREEDEPEILTGLNPDGQTCGAPLTALIRNRNVRPGDYRELRKLPRPGHADFTAGIKYGQAWDGRGGGQFSARLTAPLCFAGALALQVLAERGIQVGAHVSRIGHIEDRRADPVHPAMPLVSPDGFPAMDGEKAAAMQALIEEARQAGDSIGGEVEAVAAGVPAGIGGPYFGGLEGKLAQALFGIPAVRGIRFGDTAERGSENNDAFGTEKGRIVTLTNRSGGILGGITTGMPLCLRVEFKPTPSIALPQETVNLQTGEKETLRIQGRHDPCVVPRAVPVVEAVTALVLLDMILQEE